LGGTAVGTGINAPIDFDVDVAAEIASLTGLPFMTAPNKFTVQGSHDALVFLSGALKTIASSIYKIANDIRFLSCGPRCGIGELHLPENEPGSSIMPGKVNPTQCEALSMIAVQAIANDVAVTFGGAAGHLEMNVYKPLLIHNLMQSIGILSDGCRNFTEHTVKGMTANEKQIGEFVNRSLMLVTALSPVIGYQKAAAVAHHALHHDLTLKEATLQLTEIGEEEYDRIVDPAKMVNPYVAGS
jgi:fumarate hydratase class II